MSRNNVSEGVKKVVTEEVAFELHRMNKIFPPGKKRGIKTFQSETGLLGIKTQEVERKGVGRGVGGGGERHSACSGRCDSCMEVYREPRGWRHDGGTLNGCRGTWGLFHKQWRSH